MKFKVGDKVRAYGVGYWGEDYTYADQTDGDVTKIDELFGEQIHILVRDKKTNETYWFHPKQCRKLKLVKKERRRIWIHEYELKKLIERELKELEYLDNPQALQPGQNNVEIVEAQILEKEPEKS